MSDLNSPLEDQRLASLYRYNLLDTPAEEAFDCITRLARTALNTPIALITLIDRNRQWFKSRQGVEVSETARDLSFCNRTIEGNVALIVPNLAKDTVFCKNSLVVNKPNLRFYWGIPLRTRDGFNIGSLCVLGYEPRKPRDSEIVILSDLAKLTSDQIELRHIVDMDYATGLGTNRTFLITGAMEMEKAKKDNSSLSLIVFEIGHFSKIAPTYGHNLSDTLLRSVSAKCKSLLPSDTFFARIGGGRFAVLLPKKDLETSRILGHSLLQAVQQIKVESSNVELKPVIHIGITSFMPEDQNFAFVMTRAEIEMQHRKKMDEEQDLIHQPNNIEGASVNFGFVAS